MKSWTCLKNMFSHENSVDNQTKALAEIIQVKHATYLFIICNQDFVQDGCIWISNKKNKNAIADRKWFIYYRKNIGVLPEAQGLFLSGND